MDTRECYAWLAMLAMLAGRKPEELFGQGGSIPQLAVAAYALADEMMALGMGQQAQAAAPAPQPAPEANGKAPAELTEEELREVEDWREWLAQERPSLARVNEVLSAIKPLRKPCRVAVWAEVKAHAEGEGWEWSEERKEFVTPQQEIPW